VPPFVLFRAPPEKDMPWIESSVAASAVFLERVWRFVSRTSPRCGRAVRRQHNLRTTRKPTAAPCGNCINIRKVTRISTIAGTSYVHRALMELINTLYEEEASLSRAALRSDPADLTLLLALSLVHRTNCGSNWGARVQRSASRGRSGMRIWREKICWEIPAGHGRLRARIAVPIEHASELEKLAQSDAKVQTFLDGKTIAK